MRTPGHATWKDGRLYCCGSLAQLYKRKGEYYCHGCQYVYTLAGHSLGWHGYGMTRDAKRAEWAANPTS